MAPKARVCLCGRDSIAAGSRGCTGGSLRPGDVVLRGVMCQCSLKALPRSRPVVPALVLTFFLHCQPPFVVALILAPVLFATS